MTNASSCQFVTAGCDWCFDCNFSLCFITCHKTLPATSGLYRVSEGAIMCMTASDLLMIYASSNWAFCNARKYLLINLLRRVLSCWGIFTFAPDCLQHNHPSISMLVTGFLQALQKGEVPARPQLKIQVALPNRCVLLLKLTFLQSC